MSRLLVSIVIPTRNGAATLAPVLDALARQRADFAFETIAIDSASTDGTPDLLGGRVDLLLGIEADAFDHGLTRNLGVERARGEFVVLLVQDAVPVGDGWLSALVAPLRADATLAGTFARQLPRPAAHAITRYYHERWLGASTVARIVSLDSRGEFDSLTPAARLDRCTFDNVCSCIRRSVWARYPFRATPIGEDVEWARDVLLAGYRLAFVPAAVVVHSHDRSARYELARTFVLHRRFYELFALRTIPTVPLLVRAIASSLRTHLRCERSLRAAALAFAWPLGQYLGARAASRAWKTARIQNV